jgi:hypothetical protein
MKCEIATLVSREAQTSNTAVYRKDLPKSGCYSAIDIGIRLTNGVTSAINMDLLDAIKRISLVVNGNDYRYHLSGQEAFRLYWLRHGHPMPYTWTEAASGVNEVWFRMEFGRYIGDSLYGLDLSRFDNVQVAIDYDAVLFGGAVAGTTFATGTFTVTLIAHQFPYTKRPSFRAMLGDREFYNVASAASGDIMQGVPSSNPIAELAVMAIEDNIAEGTDITDVMIGKDNFSVLWINAKWYNLQSIQSEGLTEPIERFNLLASNAAVRDTHLANIKAAIAKPRAVTTAVA